MGLLKSEEFTVLFKQRQIEEEEDRRELSILGTTVKIVVIAKELYIKSIMQT